MKYYKLWVDINTLNHCRQYEIYPNSKETKIITYKNNNPVKIDYDDIYHDCHIKLLTYMVNDI